MKGSNSNEALNLYAQVEDLLGIKEYAPKLYKEFFSFLDKLEFNSLLDVGCGSGDFLQDISNRYKIKNILGIDRSDYMIKVARQKGVNAKNIELKKIDTRFDIITATFDMVNYLTPNELIDFFNDLKRVIRNNGYFIFDVNSEFGLSDIAVGNFIAEDTNRFLAIESFYENGIYDSNFTLFKKEENCYKKYCESIRQYYYSKDFFALLYGWEIVSMLPLKLYDLEEFDKIIYIFKSKI